jgi:DNA helicase HerA-like ATPase
MKNFFTPPRKPLVYPGTDERVLARPDLRGMFVANASGAPLSADERDYDDIVIHRDWRVYDANNAGAVKYFMYEISQRYPGQALYSSLHFKAVRLIRLTRVPRYLRQASATSGPNMLFEQQRDVMAALREQGVLFVQVIAKSPQLPLVFSYGVQGVGATPEEAQRSADEAFAVLDFQLSGTYQQLEYQPLNFEEAELLVRYQQEWGELAMARGRPVPTGGGQGVSDLLDGSRTDGTNNQLESFIRGMSDRSFMLTLVTVPISPVEITGPWRNLTQKLSDVRSETDGSRAIMAGVALPLSLGVSLGEGHGNTHTSGTSAGTGATDTVSRSTALGQSESVSHGTTFGQSITATDSQGASVSRADGFSSTQTVGQAFSEQQGTSASQAFSEQAGISSSQSSGFTQSAGQNWTNTLGQSLTASLGGADSISQGRTDGLSQTVTQGANWGDSQTGTAGTSQQGGVNAGVFGTGANTSGGQSQSIANGTTAGSSISNALAGSTSTTDTVGQSRNWGQSQGLNWGESYGGSTGQSATNTNTVGTSQSLGRTDTLGTSQSLGRTDSASDAAGRSQTATQGISSGQSLARGTSMAESVTTGQSASVTNTEGTSQAVSAQRALSDAYAVAMSRQATTASSLGVVPNVGISISRQTRDEAKRFVGDMLEAQMRRYAEGIKSGAFFYQMFLQTPDRETLVGGAGLLKSAFWGSGSNEGQLPQPFHTITEFDDDKVKHDAEKERLLTHAQAWTSYRRREPLIELIEPFLYSTYLTPSEAAAFTHPPTSEALGLLAVHDSMPVMAMPSSRQGKELHIGHIVNGERAKVSDWAYGVNLDELTHTLICGVTGSGKTQTLMRFLAEASRIERKITTAPTISNPIVGQRTLRASVIGLDWMRNMRNLAAIPELVAQGRFRFYSVRDPQLGAFRWNLLEVPAAGMSPMEWLNELADNFTASFNLGEFGRSLIAEYLTDLYSANRLEDFQLRPAVLDPGTGEVLRAAVMLPAIPREQIPADAITYDKNGKPLANVFTYPELSRCVSMAHLATIVAAKIEELANPEMARLYGTAMRDRLQSLWRRIQYFAPGGQFAEMLGCDPDLSVRTTLGVTDLVDPDKGLVTVIETDGLDHANRRLILGSVLLAVFRYGLHHGEGVFDQGGKGPGLFTVLEEAHELFGEAGQEEDAFSASTRVALYESMFRRARALGMRLVAVAQNPSSLPAAVTSNISTVFIHKVRDDADRKSVMSLLNWSNQIGQQQREFRWLGEMPTGWAIVRLDAKHHYLESAPVQILTDPVHLPQVDDAYLAQIATHPR